VVLAGVQLGGLRAFSDTDGPLDFHPAGFLVVISIIAEKVCFRDIQWQITVMQFALFSQVRMPIRH
jgi:hypothetical protein